MADDKETDGMLEDNEKINMTENPILFHVNQPSFTRNLLSPKQALQVLSPEPSKKSSKGNESSPFLQDDHDSRNSEDSPTIAFDRPEDRFHLCYIILYILGFGTLLPWNFFITANAYFKKKLETRPDFQVSFQNYFSVAAMVPNILAMLLNIFFLQRFNRVLRMSIALIVMLVIFIATTTLVLVNSTSWTEEFFGFTLFSMVLMNMASAVMQGGLFGFAGMLPPRYTQAVMGGQGLSGLFAATASIIAQLGEKNIFKSAFGYFCTASAVLIICILALIFLFRLEFVKYYTTEKKYKCTCKCEANFHNHIIDFVNEDANEKMHLQVKQKKSSSGRRSSFFIIVKKIFPMAFAVLIAFMVSLACFPSITARIVSVSTAKNAWTENFVSITCFLFFNLGDYFGRCLAGFIQLPKINWPRWILPALCLGRFIFIPLFIFCNAQPRKFPVIFNHDAFPSIFMLLFATSNGYFGSLGMMYGPSFVDGEHAELAGTIMACCISFGLGSGAVSSFLVTSFI